MPKTTIYAMGTGTISTAPYLANPLDAVWTSDLVSLRGSLSILQEEGETREVYIDQSDAPIVMTHSSGKVIITFTMPNTADAYWKKFYNTTAVAAPQTATTEAVALGALDAVGVQLSRKAMDDMLMIKMKEGGQIYIFPFVDWVSTFAKEDEDNPTAFKVTITVKANPTTSSYDFIVLNPKAA